MGLVTWLYTLGIGNFCADAAFTAVVTKKIAVSDLFMIINGFIVRTNSSNISIIITKL